MSLFLKRGLSYFKKGNVVAVEEIDAGRYEAIVEGTEEYTVGLTVIQGMVEDAVCSCPYDLGPFCKHTAAVLFYLQKEELDIQPIEKSPVPGQKKSTTAPKKRVTIMEKVREVLEKVPHEELKQFITIQCENSSNFRNLVLATFVTQHPTESKSFYSKQIKSILRSVAGRDKIIFRHKAYQVAQQVNELLAGAKKQATQKNYLSAINMATAIMEEMCEALQFADDSDGNIGSFVDLAQDLLFEMTNEPLPEDIRSFLLNYTLHTFEKNIFEGWDWHLGMLQLATQLVKDESEADKVLKSLPNLKSSKYYKEETQKIEYDIIHKIKGEREAQNFLEKHLENSSFRAIAISNSMEKLDYAKANKLAMGGIKQDEKTYPGLVIEWYNWLLKIAQAEGNRENIIKYARVLYIENFRPIQDYYQILKNNIAPENWSAFMLELVNELSKRKTWTNIDLITKICINERWWPRLLEVLKENSSLSNIENQEKYLGKDYANDLIAMYEHEIKAHLEHFTGRNHYQTACRYIRRMIKLGGSKQAEILVSELKTKYKQRKSLLEELAKV
ncbi:MAG: SWIM zinc finger family protein [Saprospiraceae bacterium]|nr:SWIM zinc finger family protein [Saprospiraceae bacterium]